MPSLKYTLIRHAMENMESIRARYDGLNRELSPHTLGIKNGVEKLLGYQFGGESKSGLEPGGSPANWRCMFVDRMADVEVLTGGIWHTAPNHSRPQTCIDLIDLEVYG